MFSCESCTKKYKRKTGISRHVKQKHETQHETQPYFTNNAGTVNTDR